MLFVALSPHAALVVVDTAGSIIETVAPENMSFPPLKVTLSYDELLSLRV